MSPRHIRRAGTYLRVVDPDWSDPLDGTFAQTRGGRWNPPGSFAVVYLNRDRETARRNVDRLLAGQPYGPEDLDPAEAYMLVSTQLPDARHLDVVTDAGCRSAGLPKTYPRDSAGATIPHATCQPIGASAHAAGAPGVACRSAAPGAGASAEELALFSDGADLVVERRWVFDDWYWGEA